MEMHKNVNQIHFKLDDIKDYLICNKPS